MDSKSMIAAAAALLFIASAAFILQTDGSSADDPDYELNIVPLVSSEAGKPDSVTFRVYEGKEYTVFTTIDAVWNIFSGRTMTVAKDAQGKFTFTNPINNTTAVFDPSNGTLHIQKFQKFILTSAQEEDVYRFMEIEEQKVIKEPEAKTFCLGEYGIPYYVDGDNVYFSLTTVNDLIRSQEVKYLGYANGENAYFLNTYDVLLMQENFLLLLTDAARIMISEQPRTADQARFAYNELRLSWDCNYGKSETSKLGTAMQNDTLDHVLETYSDTTRHIREWLQSTDNAHYYAGLYLFGMYVDDGGHTKTLIPLEQFKDVPSDFYNRTKALIDGEEKPTLVDRGLLGQQIIKPVRTQTWGDEETYHSKGDTAIYALDSFVVDKDAWEQYYDGGCVGPYPSDTVGNALTALDRAKADPNIKNFVFDYSCNTGGDAGAAVGILQIMFGGYQYLRTIDSDSGEMSYIKYMVDTNHDGRFDEKDLERQYDFKFGIITTTAAYSCGNLVPVIAKQMGAVIIGETTGGGAHTVYVGAPIEGFAFLMSSTNTMADADWKSVETGAVPDFVLVDTFSDDPDYSVLYDIDRISELMNSSDDPGSVDYTVVILTACIIVAAFLIVIQMSFKEKKP